MLFYFRIYQERYAALLKELEDLQNGKHTKFVEEVENLKSAQNNEYDYISLSIYRTLIQVFLFVISIDL